jgi:hypothetical protein
LITAGTNTGVVKEVGEALSNYRYKNRKQGLDVTCIGVGSWGYTAANEQLEMSCNLSRNRNSSKTQSRRLSRTQQHNHSLNMVG